VDFQYFPHRYKILVPVVPIKIPQVRLLLLAGDAKRAGVCGVLLD